MLIWELSFLLLITIISELIIIHVKKNVHPETSKLSNAMFLTIFVFGIKQILQANEFIIYHVLYWIQLILFFFRCHGIVIQKLRDYHQDQLMEMSNSHQHTHSSLETQLKRMKELLLQQQTQLNEKDNLITDYIKQIGWYSGQLNLYNGLPNSTNQSILFVNPIQLKMNQQMMGYRNQIDTLQSKIRLLENENKKYQQSFEIIDELKKSSNRLKDQLKEKNMLLNDLDTERIQSNRYIEELRFLISLGIKSTDRLKQIVKEQRLKLDKQTVQLEEYYSLLEKPFIPILPKTNQHDLNTYNNKINENIGNIQQIQLYNQNYDHHIPTQDKIVKTLTKAVQLKSLELKLTETLFENDRIQSINQCGISNQLSLHLHRIELYFQVLLGVVSTHSLDSSRNSTIVTDYQLLQKKYDALIDSNKILCTLAFK
ncbi:hypothetical protein BC833DRAFT_658594 [Globomyces pollinis-pini]|nr:hypothetical protein BC833DRAFT_658594 [Globomyces pollinis-pini]